MKKKLTKEYKNYIGSEEWSDRRKLFYEKVGRKCAACHTGNRLDVHHKTYSNFGHELDEDLAVLCRACHETVHQLAKTFYLQEATNLFIEMMRAQNTSAREAKNIILARAPKNVFKKSRRARKQDGRYRLGNEIQVSEADGIRRRMEMKKNIRMLTRQMHKQ